MSFSPDLKRKFFIAGAAAGSILLLGGEARANKLPHPQTPVVRATDQPFSRELLSLLNVREDESTQDTELVLNNISVTGIPKKVDYTAIPAASYNRFGGDTLFAFSADGAAPSDTDVAHIYTEQSGEFDIPGHSFGIISIKGGDVHVGSSAIHVDAQENSTSLLVIRTPHETNAASVHVSFENSGGNLKVLEVDSGDNPFLSDLAMTDLVTDAAKVSSLPVTTTVYDSVSGATSLVSRDERPIGIISAVTNLYNASLGPVRCITRGEKFNRSDVCMPTNPNPSTN